jgi:predicted RNase H-like HicB family nuclease
MLPDFGEPLRGQHPKHHCAMRSERAVFITAMWDSDAAAWVAESLDVPGLATEAESVEALVANLKDVISESLEFNAGALADEIPFELLARQAAVTRTRRR